MVHKCENKNAKTPKQKPLGRSNVENSSLVRVQLRHITFYQVFDDLVPAMCVTMRSLEHIPNEGP